MELFKVDERKVRDILSKKEIRFEIPRNQRDYVWELKQWKEFFDDIIDCIVVKDQNEFKNSEYFIGSCVLEKNKKKNSELIVDGQQRLTTITVLLSALYDHFFQLNQKQYSDGIYSYLLKKDDDGNEFFTIKNENLDPYYSEMILNKGNDKDNILPKNEQQKRISKCYDYYFNELEKYTDGKFEDDETKIKFLISFRNQLLDLKIIEISVKNELDGYTVFEILNAKGKQLELSDRMKNLILKKLPKDFPTDQAKDKWDRIKSEIELISNSDTNFSNFIKHYWISSYEKFKDNDEIYNNLKTEVSKNENMKDFLNDLEENSKVYSMIVQAKENMFPPSKDRLINQELLFSLNSFKIFRNSQVRPFLLSLFHNHRIGKINDKELLKYIRRLENFHFIFSAICSTAANKVEKVYHQYSPLIKKNFSKEAIESFFGELNSEKPDYSVFERNFLLKGYSTKNSDFKSNRRIVNYILHRFEYHKQKTNELKINDLTIEHIKNDAGTEVTSMIGNLLPLAGKINEKGKIDDFKIKKQLYQNSNFQSVKDFLEDNSHKQLWSEEDISERTKRLAKIAYERIWV